MQLLISDAVKTSYGVILETEVWTLMILNQMFQ